MLSGFFTNDAVLEISSSRPYSPDLEGNASLQDLVIGDFGDVKYVPSSCQQF